MLPDDWRRQLVEVIRGAETPDTSWFSGGPHLSPTEQIAIYQEQYRLRLGDALREELPGCLHLWGNEADAVLFAYLNAYPSESWTLDRVHQHLPRFLCETGRDAAWIEMAELECAVSRSFEARDVPPLPPEALTGTPALALSPAVERLRFRFPVHRLRSALLMEEELPSLEEGDYPVILCRPERQVRHLELHPAAWALVDTIGQGGSLAEALAVASRDTDPTWLAGQLGSWFQLFVERRVLVAG